MTPTSAKQQLQAISEKCHCWYVSWKRRCAKPEVVLYQDPCCLKCNAKGHQIQSGARKLRSKTSSLLTPLLAANPWVAVSVADLLLTMGKS